MHRGMNMSNYLFPYGKINRFAGVGCASGIHENKQNQYVRSASLFQFYINLPRPLFWTNKLIKKKAVFALSKLNNKVKLMLRGLL
jgi:hypothetical protein